MIAFAVQEVGLPLPLSGEGWGKGFPDWKISSQLRLEHSIADFVCHAAKLVIELDGGQHFSDEGERADMKRSAVLEAKGFKVLRFSNHDVLTNRTGALETIATAVAERALTLTLPRKRGRERKESTGKKQP